MIEITSSYLESQGLSENFPKRFWDKVKKTDTCWIWTGCRHPFGHGQISKGGRAGHIWAHRASWILNFGPIPEGKQVQHCCPGKHNPACVNPEHLKLGTQLENMRDTINQGTHYFSNCVPRVGEQVGTAKISDAMANFILDHYTGAYGEQTAFAKQAGVCQQTISRLVHGFSHRHLKPKLRGKKRDDPE